MKEVQISYCNQKGQLVIPKPYRDKIGIDENVPLSISIVGSTIRINPVDEVILSANTSDTYSDVLELTKGSWGKASASERKSEQKKRRLELSSSRKRRAKW